MLFFCNSFIYNNKDPFITSFDSNIVIFWMHDTS